MTFDYSRVILILVCRHFVVGKLAATRSLTVSQFSNSVIRSVSFRHSSQTSPFFFLPFEFRLFARGILLIPDIITIFDRIRNFSNLLLSNQLKKISQFQMLPRHVYP